MISFIIIGRNEGWKLTKCFRGVLNTIKTNELGNYEIIYVDSNSTDDSIERAKQFSEVKIYLLTTIYNAAIARNMGVLQAKGNTLFFIDGDMEILPEFLPLVYTENDGLKYPFVSGQLKNFNYDENDLFIDNSWQYNGVLKRDKYYSTTGGIFLIKREIWETVGGMDHRFRRGQDLELALRIAQKGYKILRKKEIVANHYTVSYRHHSRIWRTIFSGDVKYSNSFLIRKHILNPYVYTKMFRNYYTLVSLMLSIILFFVFYSPFVFLLYALGLSVKTMKSKNNNILRLAELFIYYIVRDLAFIFYLFIPMNKIDPSKISYIKIQ